MKITTLINSKTPNEDTALFRAVFDNKIPIHTLLKLHIAERLHIQPNCSRGFIHSISSEDSDDKDYFFIKYNL